MSRFQKRAVAIALAIIVLDGFDVAAMAFAAPSVAQQWDMAPAALGVLLSASLFGMAVGAIFFSPLGDRIGRRGLTMLSLGLVCVGMIFSVFAGDPSQLWIWRFVTGIGIGAMSQLNAYVSEYASDRRRGTVVGIYAAGFPIGATIAGLVAGVIIPDFGWHSVFVVGAVLSSLIFVVAVVTLPESLDFLLARRPKNALTRINSILAKIGTPVLAALPAYSESSPEPKGAIREVFSSAMLVRTLLLWLGYGCLMGGYYFATSWIPQLVTTASGQPALGTQMGVVLNVGGIVGCFAFSIVAIKFRSRPILITTLAAAAVVFVLFGVFFSVIPAAVALAALVGMLCTGAVAGFYAVAPAVYNANARSTGVGWMVGIGRLISIVSPIMVGVLLSSGWAPHHVFMLFAIPLAIGALSIFGINLSMRRAGVIDTFTSPTQAISLDDLEKVRA